MGHKTAKQRVKEKYPEALCYRGGDWSALSIFMNKSMAKFTPR